jgi:predicted DNA-binding transcriptional regulator YafY
MPAPATRVLALLELLQSRGSLPGAELAERLQVDRRTVRRYVSRLEELGVPVAAERGRHGGYRLMPGFRLPPMMFTDDEALALSVGLLAARQLGLAEAAAAAQSAQAKLERVTPPQLKRRIRAAGDTIAIELRAAQPPVRGGEPPASPPPAVPSAATGQGNALLVALGAAAQAQQRVRLRYRSAAREASERDFDPYGLGFRGGHWYVVGHCHLRRSLRSFRLDRVEAAEPIAASFLRPAGFDVLEHLAASIATLPRAFAVEVLLLAELPQARAELFATLGVLEPAPGGVLLHTQADSLDWVARELARLPFGFQVRQPAALKDAVAAHARRLLERAA